MLLRVAVVAILMASGLACFAQDQAEVQKLLRQADQSFKAGDYYAAFSNYAKVLDQNKGNLDATVGELNVWAEWGFKKLAEKSAADIWQTADKTHFVGIIRALASLYSNTTDIALAEYWLGQLKIYDNGQYKDTIGSIEKSLAEQKDVADSFSKADRYSFLVSKNPRRYQLLYFIKSLLSPNTYDVFAFKEPTADRIASALGVIEEWKQVSDGLIVISGFEPHNATARALVIFDLTAKKSVVVYWEIYHDMYLFGNAKGLIDRADVKTVFGDWKARLIDQYKSKYFDSRSYHEFDFVGF